MRLEELLFALEERFWMEGAEWYVARASSAYVSDGRAWKLAFHQQTPLA